MKSYLHIKGKNLWKLCALAILGIVINACYIRIQAINQPATATVNQVITITLTDTVQTNIGGTQQETINYVLGMLMPTGWNAGSSSISTITYTSVYGNGNMAPMPATTVEPSTVGNTNLSWSASLTAHFGIGKNLVNDVVWDVFQSTQQYTVTNGSDFNPNATIKIKVGADGDNTDFFTAFCIAESVDGINTFVGQIANRFYDELNGGCLIVTGGSTGILHDYCHPQLTSFNPPKTLDNEFVTLTYNSLLDTGATILKIKPPYYLCVDSAYLSSGPALTNLCIQTSKSILTETSTTSGMYALTFWPKSYFGLTSAQTLTRLVYYITDANGVKLGYGGSATEPFTYTFGCN
jgi:hypothetical protein